MLRLSVITLGLDFCILVLDILNWIQIQVQPGIKPFFLYYWKSRANSKMLYSLRILKHVSATILYNWLTFIFEIFFLNMHMFFYLLSFPFSTFELKSIEDNAVFFLYLWDYCNLSINWALKVMQNQKLWLRTKNKHSKLKILSFNGVMQIKKSQY